MECCTPADAAALPPARHPPRACPQVYVQRRLRPTSGQAVGPVAYCKIPLPLPPDGDDDSTGAAGSKQAAAPAAPAPAASGSTCFYFAGRLQEGPGMFLMPRLTAVALGWRCRSAHPPTRPLARRPAAGCHLEPFTEGAPLRLRAVQGLLRALPPRCRLVLAGDTNLRQKEDAAGAPRCALCAALCAHLLSPTTHSVSALTAPPSLQCSAGAWRGGCVLCHAAVLLTHC